MTSMPEQHEVTGSVTIPSTRITVEVRERRDVGCDKWGGDFALPAVPSVGHYVWCWVEQARTQRDEWRPPRRERERFRVMDVEWDLDEDEPSVNVYVERARGGETP